MNLFVNWIRNVFCDFDMFADWKSFGRCMKDLLGIIVIDVSLRCIEGITLMLLHIAVAVGDGVGTTSRSVRLGNIAAMRHTILRQFNGAGVEVSLLRSSVTDVIVGDFLHLITAAATAAATAALTRVGVVSVIVPVRCVVANIE